MDDKFFDLLAKLHSDMTAQFKSVKDDITGIKDDITGIKDDIRGLKKDIIRIENDHGRKLDALFDGYKQLAEGQEEIKSQLAALSAKVESQDVQISVLKGKKAVK